LSAINRPELPKPVKPADGRTLFDRHVKNAILNYASMVYTGAKAWLRSVTRRPEKDLR